MQRSIRKLSGVSIEFLGGVEGPIEVQAEVLERENEMVISIADQPSSPPFLVRGAKQLYFFAGVDSLEHEVSVNVVARWALLGDVYVGIWIENGAEYLFSFRLPRRPSKRRGQKDLLKGKRARIVAADTQSRAK